MKGDLSILKSQSGARVKEFIAEKLRLITPEANLEVPFTPPPHFQEVQKSELIPLAPIIPKTYEEVRLLQPRHP